MGARTKARKRALDVLYAADVRQIGASTVLAELEAERRDARGEMNPYTAELVSGVVAHRPRIDELLATHSEGWDLDRMPAVDRNLLRIGVFEVLWATEVPDGVAVSEAVDMAAEISTDDSPRFVNGVLSRIVQMKPMLPEGQNQEELPEGQSSDELPEAQSHEAASDEPVEGAE